MFGKLDGRILRNGRPFTAKLRISGDHGKRPDGSSIRTYQEVQTGSEGRVQLLLLPGRYEMAVLDKEGDSGIVFLHAREDLVLAPGQKVAQEFHFLIATVRLRVLGSDGQPCAGVKIRAESKRQRYATLPKTDANGLTSKRMDAGELRLFVLPRRLTTDPQAREEFLRQMRRDRAIWRKALIHLTTIRVPAGESSEIVEVHLPASSGY